MDNNLIPPFMMREDGLEVRDVPKFQCMDPSVEDHAIVTTDKSMIPLSLRGVFSYFPTSKPSDQDMQTLKYVHLITPERWNPYSDMHSQN